MDLYGRLTLSEMREQVRRKLDLLRFNINTVGSETSLQQIDRLISDQDLNMYLNMALARRCVDVNIADNTIMADEEPVDIITGQVEYPLPLDLMFLRALYWKPIGITGTITPPNQRVMMYEIDDDSAINNFPEWGAPSYRRRLNSFVLNDVPQQDNPMGVMVDYVKMMQPLVLDEQVLETPMAWILQQIIMQDAAVEATTQKLKLDASELRQTQQELVNQLTLAVMNYHTPKVIKLVSSVVPAYAPGVRRPSSWQNFARFGWGWF